MKRILSIACALMALLFVVTAFAACGDEPNYVIGNLSYDPESGILDWSDNSDASEWIVVIDGKEFKTKQSQITYEATNKDINVSIEGLHDKKGSEINPVLSTTIYYLETVTGLEIKDGQLRWNSVNNANAYQVYNNGSPVSTVSECAYTIPSGAFNLYVMPMRSGSYYYCYKSESLSGMILASPTTVSYSNGVFTWDAVENADYYELKINGESVTASTNSYSFAGNKKDIEISIAAGSNQAGAYVSSPLVKTCHYLTPVTEFSFDETGSLIWNPVENATHYDVVLNDQAQGTVSTPVFSNIQLDTYYTIKVTPVGEFSYTDVATPYSFEKLSPVTGIAFSNGIITWDVHARAASYEIKVNGEEFTSEKNSYNIGNIQKTITIEVYAIGEKENSRSFMSTSQTYTYLPKVDNVRVEDGILKWNASEGAVSYTIRFTNRNNQTTSVTETSFSNITPNTQYVAQIIPVGPNANFYSYWSQEFDFTVLAAPTLSYSQGVFKWQGINEAAGYTVRITDPDGKVSEKTLDKMQYTQNCDFVEKAGDYTIAVKVLADTSNDKLFDSAYSKSMTVKQLKDVTNHTVDHSSTNFDNFCFTIDAVDGASGYKIFVNEAEKTSSASNSVKLDIQSLLTDDSETTFVVEVQAIGKVTSDTIVLDSKGKYAFEVIKLATPQNVTISGTKIEWEDVNRTSKYLVSIDGKTFETSSSYYQTTNVTAGAHTVMVRALAMPSDDTSGTVTDYMSSRWSTPISFTKLAAPANVRIESAGTDTIVKWDQVNGNKGYAIKIGTNDPENWNATAYNISSHVGALKAGEGVQISIYAKGDGSTLMDSEPSATITVARLNVPTNLTFSGDNLTWTAPDVDGIKPTSYKLYIGSEEIPVTGTSYSVADLPAGEYNISIVAVGNRTTTIDSPKSESIRVVKLAEVTNVQASGTTYTWDMVSGAAQYEIKINNTTYYSTATQFDVSAIFTGKQGYSVSIRAISSDPYVIAGKAYSFTQTVETLAVPQYKNDASQLTANTFTISVDESSKTLTITALTGDVIPMQVEYYVDGMVLSTNQYTMSLGITGYEYKVQVRFIGHGFAAGVDGGIGTYYIDSPISAEVTVYEP
ncbi:MAG: fibronectin type III domain-containing protein [Ruminococcaceae bacterium]|nr:fibronectin type III domain-containing protein [Oscillospiraceae bacterium]